MQEKEFTFEYSSDYDMDALGCPPRELARDERLSPTARVIMIIILQQRGNLSITKKLFFNMFFDGVPYSVFKKGWGQLVNRGILEKKVLEMTHGENHYEKVKYIIHPFKLLM